jgi:hypothetical protein
MKKILLSILLLATRPLLAGDCTTVTSKKRNDFLFGLFTKPTRFNPRVGNLDVAPQSGGVLLCADTANSSTCDENDYVVIRMPALHPDDKNNNEFYDKNSFFARFKCGDNRRAESIYKDNERAPASSRRHWGIVNKDGAIITDHSNDESINAEEYFNSVPICDNIDSECTGNKIVDWKYYNPTDKDFWDIDKQEVNTSGTLVKSGFCRVPQCNIMLANSVTDFLSKMGIVNGVVADKEKLNAALAKNPKLIQEGLNIVKDPANAKLLITAFANACVGYDVCRTALINAMEPHADLFAKAIAEIPAVSDFVKTQLGDGTSQLSKELIKAFVGSEILQNAVVNTLGQSKEFMGTFATAIAVTCESANTPCARLLEKLQPELARELANAIIASNRKFSDEVVALVAAKIYDEKMTNVSDVAILDALAARAGLTRQDLINIVSEVAKQGIAETERRMSVVETKLQIANLWKDLTSFERSGWTTKDGGFNGMRLGLDIGGGALVGTSAGVATNVLLKKAQIEKGFSSFMCTFPGGNAGWGETFIVR